MFLLLCIVVGRFVFIPYRQSQINEVDHVVSDLMKVSLFLIGNLKSGSIDTYDGWWYESLFLIGNLK